VTGLYLDARGREKHVINQLDRRSLRSVKIGQQLNATANVIDGSAAIIGYVALVKPGAAETCNCKAKDAAHKDTHIALVTNPANAKDESKYVIVEVTPRTRRR
jgi:hypothetical protein